MLERTAASIEPCHLQRVLSRPARSGSRHRQLCQGFWQHGASAIELGSPWPSHVRAPTLAAGDSAGARQQTALASAVFLDFLYPQPAVDSLRRTYPGLPRHQGRAGLPSAPRRRRFASSRPSDKWEDERPPPETAPASPKPGLSIDDKMRAGRRRDDTRRGSGGAGSGGFPTNDAFSALARNKRSRPRAPATRPTIHDPEDAPVLDHIRASGSQDEALKRQDGEEVHLDDMSEPNGQGFASRHDPPKTFAPLVRRHPSELPDLLKRPEDELYNDVWDLYSRTSEEEQAGARLQVLLYLSKSRGIVETGRCMSLLPQVPADQRNDEFSAAAVLTYMRSGDLPGAIEQFKERLRSARLSGGLEYILSDAIFNQQWHTAVDVWMAYCHTCLSGHEDVSPDASRLRELGTLPDLGKLYISFEKWIAQEILSDRAAVDAMQSKGLAILRRKLAELALQQPCSPRQAEPILKSIGEPQAYHDYLLRMVTRLEEKQETKGSLTILPDIYAVYRRMTGSGSSVTLLRGMFNLYFPQSASGLEQIFDDWHSVHGDLDQWGYQKFLKFYARTGDVKAVQKLWQRYVERYPKAVKSPRGFRSTMNVYAQIGNVELAKKELRKMIEEYGVEPDIDTYNAVLKCCVRADDYGLALEYFDTICERREPDAFTYAHVMSMTGKRGDLAKTLEFYNRSQKQGIETTEKMILPLVTAYTRSGQTQEAERICVELAGRKLISRDAWIELIRWYGLECKMEKCRELLQTMKTYGIEWDQDTYEALFQAMVNSRYIDQAYLLLRRAYSDRLFTVTSSHFSTVLVGAVRLNIVSLAQAIARRMHDLGMHINFNAFVHLVEAAYREGPQAVNTKKMAEELPEKLRSVLSYQNTGRRGRDAKDRRASVAGESRDMRWLVKETKSMGRAMKLLVDHGEFAIAEDLMNVYLDIFPDRARNHAFPQYLVSALMAAHLNEGEYDKVREMWKENFAATLKVSLKSDGNGIYPAKEFVLSSTVAVMIKLYMEQRDPNGLLECVRTVTKAGFKLVSSNWNVACSSLARMGQWEPAMVWCEALLMPRWRGWDSKRLWAEELPTLSPRYLLPTIETVLELMSHWLRLRKLAAWSGEASVQVRKVEERFPRLYHAFTSATAEKSGVQHHKWILDGKADVKASIDRLLEPLSVAELADLRRALHAQRYAILRGPTREADRRDSTHFFRAVGDAGETEPVPEPDLESLDSAVSAKLTSNALDALEGDDATGAGRVDRRGAPVGGRP